MTEARFYTYAHYKADTGEIFYIGKGTKNRHSGSSGRSKFWKSVVAKHGFRSEILARFVNENEAFEHEVFLIACFREIGAVLCNLTDGGEGMAGHKLPPDKLKLRNEAIRQALQRPDVQQRRSASLSKALKGKTFSEERKAKLSEVKRGKPLSESHRLALIGKTITAAHRQALVEANARPDVRARRSEAIAKTMKGYVKSPEHRRNLAIAAKAAWARIKADKALLQN